MTIHFSLSYCVITLLNILNNCLWSFNKISNLILTRNFQRIGHSGRDPEVWKWFESSAYLESSFCFKRTLWWLCLNESSLHSQVALCCLWLWQVLRAPAVSIWPLYHAWCDGQVQHRGTEGTGWALLLWRASLVSCTLATAPPLISGCVQSVRPSWFVPDGVTIWMELPFPFLVSRTIQCELALTLSFK